MVPLSEPCLRFVYGKDEQVVGCWYVKYSFWHWNIEQNFWDWNVKHSLWCFNIKHNFKPWNVKHCFWHVFFFFPPFSFTKSDLQDVHVLVYQAWSRGKPWIRRVLPCQTLELLLFEIARVLSTLIFLLVILKLQHQLLQEMMYFRWMINHFILRYKYSRCKVIDWVT